MGWFESNKNIDIFEKNGIVYKHEDLIKKLREIAITDSACTGHMGDKTKCYDEKVLKRIYDKNPSYYNHLLNKHGGKSRRNRSKRKRNTKNKRRKSKRTRKSRR